MMFIKSVFALYFAAIAIAAPQPQANGNTGTDRTSSLKPRPLTASLIKPL